jgi:asparagine synthase (glutamine-hydrolysing)
VSAVLGVFATDGRTLSEPAVHRMMGAMRARGADRSALWRGEGALLAVQRHAWEMDADFAGDVLVLVDDDLVVAADASIYYRTDLRRAVERRGVALTGETASHYVLAAYRAWGEECAAHLEGDFAFIVWNRKTQRVCAARDYGGKRTLFYAQIGGTLVLASTVGGVLAHPECSNEINLTAVAETAAGMFAASHETCYRAIQGVPAGCTLVRRGTSRADLLRHWSPPPMEPRTDLSFDDAADTLQALLRTAAAERMATRGASSVWMSGGWDSPAVFAAGQAELRETGDSARSLLPVSMSYPPGDPGREDELIQVIADYWKTPVQWVDIRDVPFFERVEEGAAVRDEPFAHPFEMWNRSLARGSRAVGAHVAFEGVGGDQLFQVSEVYLADLFRAGRWLELKREWEAKGLRGSGFREFFAWAIQPVLPRPALSLAALLRGGRPLVGYLERRPPSWLDREFVRRNNLEERERAFTPRRGRGTCVAYETEWYLAHPYFPLVFGCVASFALEEGVEMRSPLYDRRVIEFALTRPREERSAGRETKRLLRRAVRDLLPAEVLAPRPVKTGLTSGYFDRSMRAQFPALCDKMLRSSTLVDAGIIDAEEFRRSLTAYMRRATGDQVGPNLYFTLQAEFWLRARMRPASEAAGELPVEPAVMTAG